MKKIKEIPTEVLQHIQSEHERALAKIMTSDTAIANLPARPVRMKVLRPSGNGTPQIEAVIAPAVSAYIAKSSIIDGILLATSAIRYVLPYTGKPFPYAHVFSSSGYVCLGSIFVPSTVSIYNPQQPLETLFLHNDRHTSHGGATITTTNKIIDSIAEILEFYDIEFSRDVKETFVSGQNLLRNDAIWILSADVVKQTSNLLLATDIMDNVYQTIFRTKEDKKGE